MSGSQTPACWQGPGGAQETVPVLSHSPASHASPVVQASSSLQEVPFALGATEQAPSDGLQTPTVQSPSAGQLFGLAPAQEPDWQESVWVQALPSLQEVPFASAVDTQSPVSWSQLPPVKQAPAAAQNFCDPPHEPCQQASPVVQRLLSLQAVPLGALGFEQYPVDGLQVPAEWH